MRAIFPTASLREGFAYAEAFGYGIQSFGDGATDGWRRLTVLLPAGRDVGACAAFLAGRDVVLTPVACNCFSSRRLRLRRSLRLRQ